MTKRYCPYLTNWDAQGRTTPPIDYPSFENHCLGLHDGDSLLLADQATFCLSGSHALCPLYSALQAMEPRESEQPATSFQRPTYQQRNTETARVPTTAPFIPYTPSPQTPSAASATASTVTADDQPWQATHMGGTNRGQMDDMETMAETAWAAADEDVDTAHPMPLLGERWEKWLPSSNRWWTWASAVMLFVTVIVVGGLFAAYAGWQLALDQLATARAGQVSTLANAPIEQAVQPVWLVMTATPESAPPAATSAPVVIEPRTGQVIKPGPDSGDHALAPTNNEELDYPAAVTPTPIVLVPLPTTNTSNNSTSPPEQPPASENQVILPTATPASIALPPADATATPVPVINVQVAVPTRRPTPEFDIPTSTPEPPQPTATNTVAPILGTPVVVFAPDESAVPPGECTKVRWHVENVREVYYENLPAFGDGNKEECLEDERDTYALTVIFGDGQTKIYTTTVGIVWPTPTPSVTPSYTPEIEPTETWTPLPPTATPTPNVVYGTTLSINSDNPARCNAGETCTIGVLATNTGDTLDTLAIELVANGTWPAMLCSQVGTCGSPRLVVANVGPANTVFVDLQITVPGDAQGQSTGYAVRSVSDGSSGAISSQVSEITIVINE